MGLFSKSTPAKRDAAEAAQQDAAGPSGASAAASGPSAGGHMVDTTEEPVKDVLLQIPLVELHKVCCPCVCTVT